MDGVFFFSPPCKDVHVYQRNGDILKSQYTKTSCAFFFIFITVFIFYRPPAKNVMHKEKVHNFTRICYTPVPRAPTVFYRLPAKNVMHKEKVHNFTRICYTPMPRAPIVDIATQSSRHSFKQVVVQTNCTQKFYTMLTKHSIKRIGDNIHIAANHFKTTVIAGRSHTNSPASL